MAGHLVKLADVSHILPLYPFYLRLCNYQPIYRGSTMFQPNIIIIILYNKWGVVGSFCCGSLSFLFGLELAWHF